MLDDYLIGINFYFDRVIGSKGSLVDVITDNSEHDRSKSVTCKNSSFRFVQGTNGGPKATRAYRFHNNFYFMAGI